MYSLSKDWGFLIDINTAIFLKKKKLVAIGGIAQDVKYGNLVSGSTLHWFPFPSDITLDTLGTLHFDVLLKSGDAI